MNFRLAPKNSLITLMAYCFLWFAVTNSHAQETNKTIIKEGRINDDLYLAGGDIHALADVSGDIITAGGRISIKQTIDGDIAAAGGKITLQAKISDDVRLAGGDLTLSSYINDDAILAGGSITLTPENVIGGRAWLAGGYLDIAGNIKEELKAAGARIVINAKIDGDVKLNGDSIHILSGTVINGDLVYKSPKQAKIDSGAKINGTVNYIPYRHTEIDISKGKVVLAAFLLFIAVIAAAILTGIVLYWFFPGLFNTSLKLANQEPLKYLGLGLVILVLLPPIAGLLFVSIIGIPIAVILLLIYSLMICLSIYISIFYTSDRINSWIKKDREISKRQRLIYFSITIFLAIIVSLIPFIGGLIIMLLLFLGVGTLSQTAYQVLKN